MTLRTLSLALAASILAALALAAPASAQLYWTNQTTGTISKATLDGTTVDPNFITGATAPRGLAMDGSFLYWAHDGAPGDAPAGNIGRAPINGVAPNQTFLTTVASPQGVAVDTSLLYWTQNNGTIARFTRTGFPVAQSFCAPPVAGCFVPSDPTPCGITSDADEIYWGNTGSPGGIGNSHGGNNINQAFISATDNPCGVALANGFIYYTNQTGDSIGRADLTGSNQTEDFIPLSATPAPCGVAVDENHVYWTSASKVGRGSPAGGAPGAGEDFITTGVSGGCGITVQPTQEVSPQTQAFPSTAVGNESQIESFLVSNTASSILDVTSVNLIGANPEDFELTGDGCSVNVTMPGIGCLLNVRFTPDSTGPSTATVRVTSNASDSPNDIELSGTGIAPAGGGGGGGTTTTGPTGTTPDTVAPEFLSASVKPSRFEVDPNGAAEVPLRAKGTRFVYTLSEAARVTFAIEKKAEGRVVGGVCVPEKDSNRNHPECTLIKPMGSFLQDSAAGAAENPFSGLIGKRKLRSAAYRANLEATDVSGNRSAPRVLNFRVLDRKG